MFSTHALFVHVYCFGDSDWGTCAAYLFALRARDYHLLFTHIGINTLSIYLITPHTSEVNWHTFLQVEYRVGCCWRTYLIIYLIVINCVTYGHMCVCVCVCARVYVCMWVNYSFVHTAMFRLIWIMCPTTKSIYSCCNPLPGYWTTEHDATILTKQSITMSTFQPQTGVFVKITGWIKLTWLV
jgi:hypothetical protein